MTMRRLTIGEYVHEFPGDEMDDSEALDYVLVLFDPGDNYTVTFEEC